MARFSVLMFGSFCHASGQTALQSLPKRLESGVKVARVGCVSRAASQTGHSAAVSSPKSLCECIQCTSVAFTLYNEIFKPRQKFGELVARNSMRRLMLP